MREFGHIGIFFKALIFPLLSYKQQQKLQMKRLKKLVRQAKAKSRYFAELYKGIGEDFKLTDLPVTTKQMMMENFDHWLTDSSLSMDQVREFKKDKNNIGRKIKNRYMVAETSGSTGYPATMLLDNTSQKAETIMSCLRAFSFKLPICTICVDDGFAISNGSVRHNIGRYPFLRKFIQIADVKKPLEELCAELNGKRPKVLIGYPGRLALLVDSAIEGKLKIKPSLILTSGELLTEVRRKKLSKAFNCKVHSLYGCTEGGTMAFECRYNHMHVNRDWCILEPVDAEYKPVPPGKIASKVLLTNLGNFVQPIIRYEVTDRVIFHNEPCKCGKKGPWIEVEGRTSDIIYFQGDGKRVGVEPISLIFTMDVIQGINNFQIILHPKNTIELRLVCMKDADPETTFISIRDRIFDYLQGLGVSEVSMYLSNIPPQFHPRSGKFKQIYQVED